jgi:hypothetical protein
MPNLAVWGQQPGSATLRGDDAMGLVETADEPITLFLGLMQKSKS